MPRVSDKFRCTALVVVPQPNTTNSRRAKMEFLHRQCSRPSSQLSDTPTQPTWFGSEVFEDEFKFHEGVMPWTTSKVKTIRQSSQEAGR
jgi:hypothetical protein